MNPDIQPGNFDIGQNFSKVKAMLLAKMSEK